MKRARTIEEIQHLAALSTKRGVNKYGCAQQPLFPTIPVDHVVPDIYICSFASLMFSEIYLFLNFADLMVLKNLECKFLTDEKLATLQHMNGF